MYASRSALLAQQLRTEIGSVPSSPHGGPALVVMMGLPGVGKSYCARLLCERLGAALTSAGSIKGGPYSGGVVPGSQQYGVLEVYDNGGPSVACRYLGMRAGEGAKRSLLIDGGCH